MLPMGGPGGWFGVMTSQSLVSAGGKPSSTTFCAGRDGPPHSGVGEPSSLPSGGHSRSVADMNPRRGGEADWKPAGGLPPGRGLDFAASPASNDTEETYSLMLSRLIPAIRPNHLSCGYLYFSAGVRCGLCNLSMR